MFCLVFLMIPRLLCAVNIMVSKLRVDATSSWQPYKSSLWHLASSEELLSGGADVTVCKLVLLESIKGTRGNRFECSTELRGTCEEAAQ